MICDPLGLLKILGAFLVCSLIGWFLVQPASKTRALILMTYNDNAEQVPAFVTWGSQTHQPTGIGPFDCKWEQTEGSALTISVEPKDTKRYGPKRDLSLKWMSQDEYSQWLHKDFLELLKKRHASLTKWQSVIDGIYGRSGEVTFIYPVLVESK